MLLLFFLCFVCLFFLCEKMTTKEELDFLAGNDDLTVYEDIKKPPSVDHTNALQRQLRSTSRTISIGCYLVVVISIACVIILGVVILVSATLGKFFLLSTPHTAKTKRRKGKEDFLVDGDGSCFAWNTNYFVRFKKRSKCFDYF